MKYLIISIVSILTLLNAGCTSSDSRNNEKMYDLASQFKDLSQTVDGTIKFGDVEIENGNQALEIVSTEQPNIVAPFAEYTIKVEMQGDNAVLLLCEDDIALIEDAGCNAIIDAVYWQAPKSNSCVFSLDSTPLCK